MAIDYTGITSIDAGAPDIKYTGDEGPRSPEENKEIASAILGDEVGEVASQLWNGMSPSEKSEWRSIEGFIQSEDFKIILMQLQSSQQEGRGGIQTASAADPMLQEEYDKYVFEMEEQGLQPMSLEDFRQQAVAGMATGGRVGLWNGGPPGGGDKKMSYSAPAANRESRRTSQYSAPAPKPKPKPQQTYSPHTDPGVGFQGTEPAYVMSGKKKHYQGSEKYKEEIKKSQDIVKEHQETIPEKIKKKKDQYSNWYNKNQIAYIQKTKKKALIDRLNKYLNLTGDNLLTLEDDDETIFNVMQNLESEKFMDQKTGAHYPGSSGLAALDMISGALGAPHFSKEQAMDYWSDYKNVADWKGTDPNMPDWLERMKKFSPNQYAIYTGQNASRDPRTGQFTFTPRSDDQGGNQGVMQTAALPATTAAATQAATPGTIPTGPITVAGGIDPAHQAILKNIYGGTLPTMFAADGGRAGYAGGGIADLRQGYFLGKLVKSITKPFKKALKSPLGKIGLMALGGWGASKMFPGMMPGLKKMIMGTPTWDPSGTATKGGLWNLIKNNPFESILGASALGGLYTGMTQKDDEDEQFKKWLAEKQAADADWIPKFDQSNFRRIEFSADGGRIGYNEGGNDEDHRSDALTELYKPRMMAQEGGLMDMGGMEKDYRNEGGFVPIGGQERADDVPARLSKNEFVFTADAVRNAGGGDIDKGAEIMENLMENLEKGGKVSEESQGLEGARDMFATAQRLEGVL